MLMLWNEKYNVGDPVIDGQHRQLVQMINDLHNSSIAGGLSVTRFMIQDLMKFVTQHFSTEEMLLQKNRYSELDEHKTQHDALASQVMRYADQVGETDLPVIELQDFLLTWMHAHLRDDYKWAVALGLRKEPALAQPRGLYSP